MAQPEQPHILIVEDSDRIALAFQRALEQIGRAKIVERVDQVFEQIIDFDPHVILLDIVLEGETIHSTWDAGVRILERIKQLRPPFREIPVIIVTARIDPEVEATCLKLGATTFLRKPVSIDRLRQAVRQALETSRQLSQRTKVFISSAMQELRAERLEVKRVIEELGPRYKTEMAEEFRARSEPPCEVCRRAAVECDVFILLLGRRYGLPIAPGGISPTEDEYNAAQAVGKQIFVFVKDVRNREPRQSAFVARLSDFRQGHWVKHFSDTAQLRIEVLKASEGFAAPGDLIGSHMEARMQSPDPLWSILTDAVRFLFDQAGELLKERRDKRKAQVAAKSAPPSAPATQPSTPADRGVTNAETLLDLFKRKADLAVQESESRQVESLVRQLQIHAKTVNRYREEEANPLSVTDRVTVAAEIERHQEQIAQKSVELRTILERLSGYSIHVEALEGE